MTKIVKTAAVALLLAIVPVARANAQTVYRTNVLINLAFNLTSYEQVYLFLTTNGFDGPYNPVAKTTKIPTSALIGAIAQQAHITNNVTDAKLYWRMSWTNSADNITYDTILRRGTTDTVVNNYIQVNFPDTVSLVMPTTSGTTNVTDYSHCTVSLSTSQGSFTIHGIATMKSASLKYNTRIVEPTPIPLSFTTTVAGSGSRGFHQTEWKGTLIGSGQKVEIEQISP